MNSIVIENEIIDLLNEKCDGFSLSQLIVEEFIFPEVKICIKNEKNENFLVFKLKFIQGTRNFECKAFGADHEFRFNVGFTMQFEERQKRFAFNSLREKDLYAFDYMFQDYATDSARRELWQNRVRELGNIVLAVCYNIMNYEPNVVVKDNPLEELLKLIPPEKLEQQKEHIIRPKKDGNKTYLFRDIVKYVNHKKAQQKKHITCECWGVRGHYRHYKNGKVTFIHEYEKGAKRGQIKPQDKTYIWGSNKNGDTDKSGNNV